MEHDGGVILGLDGLDVGQQGGRTVLVVDLLDTVEGELDVGGGQIVAVRELQALLELDGELGAVGAPGAVIGGDVRRQLGSVVVLRVQEREHLNLHGVGTVVVGAAGSRLVILSVVPTVMVLPVAAPPSFTPPQAAREARAATEARAAITFLRFTMESSLFYPNRPCARRYSDKNRRAMLTVRFIGGRFTHLPYIRRFLLCIKTAKFQRFND